MKARILLIVGIVAAAMLLPRTTCEWPDATPVDPAAMLAAPHTDEVVVVFHDGVDQADMQSLDNQLGIQLHPNSPFSDAAHLRVASVPPSRMAAVLEALQRDPRVESAEPNFILHGEWDDKSIVEFSRLVPGRVMAPDDPLYKFQWHMQKIDVEKAWTATTGKDVVVAIIDTGVAYEDYGKFRQVEDLKQTKFATGWNFVSGNSHANDDHCHGTHVAGTVAQSTNNGIGVVGVAPHAVIMPIKVLSAQGSGRVSDVAEGIRYAADHGARVINLSLGGPYSASVLEKACQHAYNKGVVIVCAAGNANSTDVSYPARYAQCIAVSATRYDDQLTFYSNRGKRIDIAAPGGDMNVDQNGDGMKDGVLQNTIGRMDPTVEAYSLFQGTSMAAPHVAGAVALLVAQGVTKPEAVRKLLRDTARKEGLDLPSGYGGGVLDVGKATVKATLMDPLARLLLGLLALVAMFCALPAQTPNARCWWRKTRLTTGTLVGLVMGSAGLFFLPWLGVDAPSLLTQPVPDWDLPLSGLSAHANVLFWSAFIPIVLALCGLLQRRLLAPCMGLSIGMGAFLVHEMMEMTADIQGVPGGLEPLWLLLNAAVCFSLAWRLGLALRRDDRDWEEAS